MFLTNMRVMFLSVVFFAVMLKQNEMESEWMDCPEQQSPALCGLPLYHCEKVVVKVMSYCRLSVCMCVVVVVLG